MNTYCIFMIDYDMYCTDHCWRHLEAACLGGAVWVGWNHHVVDYHQRQFQRHLKYSKKNTSLKLQKQNKTIIVTFWQPEQSLQQPNDFYSQEQLTRLLSMQSEIGLLNLGTMVVTI